MNDFLFNPSFVKHKNPLGAINSEAWINVYINKYFNIYNLRIHIYSDSNIKIFDEELKYSNYDDYYNIYSIKINIKDSGIYWYYFSFDDCYGKHFLGALDNLDCYLSDEIPKAYQISKFDNFMGSLDWFKGGVMYQIFPDRFYKYDQKKTKNYGYMHENWDELPYYKPIDGKILNNDFFGGNLKGIIKKLDYLKELNVNTIYLNPIFEAYSNHRYDTADYSKIDDLLGSEDDFKILCEKAFKMGIRVIFDGVFNHTGSDSIYFNKENRYDGGAYNSMESIYYNWYRFIDYPNKYESWWGFDTLPSLNQNSKEYISYITGDNGIINKWLELGASGVRLDVVDELNDNFVNLINKAVKKVNKENLIIGEVWEDASNKCAYGYRRNYFNGHQLDSVMNYPFKDSIINYILTNDAYNLSTCVRCIVNNYPKHVLDSLMNILSTHDTVRILTIFANVTYDKTRDEEANYKLSIHEYQLAKSRLKMASIIQYTLPGVPCIYYGDEVGLDGFRDPFSRKTMPWGNFDDELLNHYKKLGEIRKNKVLKDGFYNELYVNNGIYVYERYNDTSVMVIICNNSNNTYDYKIDGYDLINDLDVSIVHLEPREARIVLKK